MEKLKALEKRYDEDESPRYLKYCPDVIFKYSLIALQYLFRYCVLIFTFLAEFKRVYAASSRPFSGGLSYDYLQHDMGNLSKLPRHMSFVINEDVATNYCDIANIVCWTIAMGIPYITLYDRHGIFKAGETRLGKYIQEKVLDFFGPQRSKDIDVVLKNSSVSYKNGITYPKRHCIQLLCEEDGKADIVNTAKRISSEYTEKKITLDDININYIDQSLNACKNIPDPDLIIQFGPVQSLMGFLPWQTRLSEIINLPSYKNLSYSSFLQCLSKYSKCDQRFGK